MNIAELTQRIESRYTVGASTDTALSVTGEPYVSIGSQHPADGMPAIPGTIDEGCRCETGFSEEDACWQAWAMFQEYAEDRHGKLYWRQKPMIESNGKDHRVFMRLLLSDAPVIAGKDRGRR